MLVKSYSKTGKLNKTDSKIGYDLPDDIFAQKVNDALLAQYVYSYLANQRQANAHTKDRGEVSGGGKKPWNQKGTGRARAGSIRSPLWKGGGITFGPKNTRNFKKPMSKKMIKGAFRSAFSLAAKNQVINVIETFAIKEATTKAALEILKEFVDDKKVTIVQNGANKELMMAIRNIENFEIVNVVELNPYTIINARKLLLIEDSLDYIKKNWSGKAVKKSMPKAVEKKVKKTIEVKSEVEKSEKKVVKAVVKKATVKAVAKKPAAKTATKKVTKKTSKAK